MSEVDLSVFFNPSGVAVIGASREPGKLGHDVVRNLVNHGYTGKIYPINPRAEEVMGLPAYPHLAEVAGPVDLAVIVVPARFVAEALTDCGKQGIKGAIVVSGGFREIGPEGAAAEAELTQIAAQYNIALVGPNCIGTIDTHTPLNSTFVTGAPVPGHIAMLSQSGALAATVINWAEKEHYGFSRLVSLGNQAGVTESQMLAAIVQDNRTRVVTAYIEGVTDGGEFLEITQQVNQQTPIVALKAGRGQGGAKAVASHTGALAGSESAYDAAFRRAGVLRPHTFEEMMDWAQALANQPLPRGNRVAVLTNAGGLGIMAVDSLEMAGMQLAPLTDATREYLRQRVPPAASINNPVDILAGSGPATYAICLDTLLRDETVDAVVVITAPQDWFDPVSLAEVISDLGNGPVSRNKPVLSAILGPTPDSPAAHLLRQRHIPNFAFPERLGGALGAMWQRQQWLTEQTQDSPQLPSTEIDHPKARQIINTSLEAREDDKKPFWLPAGAVDALLQAYGITIPQSGIATNNTQAADIAEQIGFPVVLKLLLKDVSHKTDIGGIVLDIQNQDELKQAYAELMTKAEEHVDDPADIEGVLVQQMVDDGIELITGVVRDPQFGPLVMAGVGGTLVELMGDVAFELAPLNQQQANYLLDQTAAGTLLAGYRNSGPTDREATIDTIQLLAQIALDLPQVSEIEINPLIVRPTGLGAVAVDARIRIQP